MKSLGLGLGLGLGFMVWTRSHAAPVAYAQLQRHRGRRDGLWARATQKWTRQPCPSVRGWAWAETFWPQRGRLSAFAVAVSLGLQALAVRLLLQPRFEVGVGVGVGVGARARALDAVVVCLALAVLVLLWQ